MPQPRFKIIPDFTISTFYGTNTARKDIEKLRPGTSPDSLNWITGRDLDHIELRRGYKRLGTTEQTGAGKVTGMGVGIRYDGTQVLWYSHDRKIKYYNAALDDTAEVSTTNILPAAASGEDVWMQQYQGLAGSFMYAGSPNSSAYKIPVANPSSAFDQYVNNYRFGVFHVGQNRSFAGQRNGITAGNNDKTGLYLSYIDKAQLSSFTQITGEAVGNLGSTTYAGTLVLKNRTFTVTIATPGVFSATAHNLIVGDAVSFTTTGALPTGLVVGTVYYVIAGGFTADAFEVSATPGGSAIATSGTQSGTHKLTKLRASIMYPSFVEAGATGETLVDDRNGNLVGNQGSTGTIDYATGIYSITFNHVTAGNVTVSYYWEDSVTTGLLDYSGSLNGQGKSFRQDDAGGNLMAIFNLNTVEYCFHLLRTWQLQTSLDDTASTNLPYRNVGIPYSRAACQTPEGIIFADLSRSADPRFRRLQVLQGTTNQTIEPLSLSDSLDLTPFSYDYCIAFRWGDYEIFCVQDKINEVANAFNSVMWVRNVFSGVWDKLNYYASVLAEYQGTLVAGDSVSNNPYTLFSGFDEDGDIIKNYWTSSNLNLGLKDLKTCRRMVLNGLIQKDQSYKVSLAYDGGAFSDIYTISGNGSYVDTGIDSYIGGPTIGSKVIGGGGATTAHPYEVDFPINSDRFIFVRVRVEALGIGYVSVDSIVFKDIRDKGRKNLPTRTV